MLKDTYFDAYYCTMIVERCSVVFVVCMRRVSNHFFGRVFGPVVFTVPEVDRLWGEGCRGERGCRPPPFTRHVCVVLPSDVLAYFLPCVGPLQGLLYNIDLGDIIFFAASAVLYFPRMPTATTC